MKPFPLYYRVKNWLVNSIMASSLIINSLVIVVYLIQYFEVTVEKSKSLVGRILII